MMLIRFGLILFGAHVLVVRGVAEEPAPSVQRRIEAYLAHTGSADHLGPDFEKLLVKDLENASHRTLDSIRSRIRSVEDLTTLAPWEQRQHLASLRLLVLCCEDGRQLAAEQLERSIVHRSRQASAHRGKPLSNPKEVDKQERTLYLLQTVIIRALGELNDGRIVPTALILVGKGGRAIRSDTLRYYFKPLLAHDLEARQAVRQALVSKDSPVFGDEELRTLLAELEKQYP